MKEQLVLPMLFSPSFVGINVQNKIGSHKNTLIHITNQREKLVLILMGMIQSFYIKSRQEFLLKNYK